MASVHIPVHDSSVSDEFMDDPFDEHLEMTFPPLRYCPVVTAKPQPKHRRESSRERERLYRELVGHEPYKLQHQLSNAGKGGNFWVTLDVKHYKPEEVTVKVEGQTLTVSGKHYNESESGFESSEFQRKYTMDDSIEVHTLTSNITTDGVLCIKATKKLPQGAVIDEMIENFQLTLDVSGYRPDEISIRVNGRNLVIHGETKDEKSSDHVHHQQFTRHFTLPADVDIEALSSRYTKDNTLTVEAPRGIASQVRTLEIKEE